MDFLEYWNMAERPFENTGDPKFFYYSPNHKEALVRLTYVIKKNKAGALLAGDYGTGKTSIANELLEEIKESEDYHSVCIRNPILSSKELLSEIAYQLGVTENFKSRLELRRAIEGALHKIVMEERHTVIIIDEAHLMTRREALEELRLLMNLQYDNQFMATIIMMGQLELRNVINSMPQFKQRFAIFYALKHLPAEETSKYIQHRLQISGTGASIFSDTACGIIHKSSVGRPRQINNICDMSLLVGSMRKVSQIDEDIVTEVIKDLGEEI
ncbi:MAG: AAA family ATPase [Candidatus Omnitrophica bacterium]|nr:AAA family ATPase [Candidatus Omnitrophota bacterium]